MRRLTALGSILFMLAACGEDRNPMTSQATDVPAPAAKPGGNGGETAYTSDAGSGTFVGYNETDCPDYGITEYTLWAGKTNDAGTVTVTNDDDNLYVTYNTNGTADLGEVHVYVWDDLADIPSKRPAPGHAPYTAENINADSYTVTIPSSLECGDVLYISTHAALVADGAGDDDSDDGTGGNDGETAYAGGSNTEGGFPTGRGAWWGYVTYTVECFFDISGTVYEDADNNADLNDETGFEGIVVNLLDSAGNVIATTTTDADGGYLFEHVPGGDDYSVVVVEGPADHIATENDGGFSISELTDCATDVDFGFVPVYDISGTVYDDADNNSDLNGESGLEGIVVNLLDGDGNVIATTTTDADGNYLFEDVIGGGDYSIVVDAGPAGYDATENAGGFVITDLGGDLSGVDFGYYLEPVTFDPCDTNVDGIVDAAEAAACGGPNFDPCDANEDGFVDAVEADLCDGGGPDESGHETAFVAGDYSFCDDNAPVDGANDFTRWGWGNTLADGQSVTQDVIAGAGRCDQNKGTVVGGVTISRSGDDITVSATFGSGFHMDVMHVYAGGTHYPAGSGGPTLAPGKYTYNSGVLSQETYQTATVTAESVGANDEIYVIVHMDAGGF